MLTCNKCGFRGSLDLFIKDKRAANGHRNKCKECERARIRKYQEDNRDKVNEANRKSYQKHREKRLEKYAEYAEENKEVRSIQASKRYLKNKEEYLIKCAEYRRNNPQVAKRAKARRRSREASLPHTLTSEEFVEIINKFSGGCAICEGGYEHLDHFIPLRTGHGGTIKGNVVPMCAACNLSKSGRNPFIWAKQLSEKERERFDGLVRYLSDINGIAAVEDYEAHVNNCFK